MPEIEPHRELGQVTGLLWRGPAELATYRALRAYAQQRGLPVATAAKQLLATALAATLPEAKR